MAWLLRLGLAGLVASLAHAAGDWAEVQALVEPLRDANDSVVALTDAAFREVVYHPAVKFAFIEFYAPWCPHCKALAPIMAELSDVVAGRPELEGVLVAKVDVTAQKAIGQWYNVVNFPTLYTFYSRTKINPYHGKREMEPMLQHVQYTAQTRPRSLNHGLFQRRGLALPESTFAVAYIDGFDSALGKTVQHFALRQQWLGVGAVTGTPTDDENFGKLVISSDPNGPFLEGPSGVKVDIPEGDVALLENRTEASRTPLVYLHRKKDQGKVIFAATHTSYHCVTFVDGDMETSAASEHEALLQAVAGAARTQEEAVQYSVVYVAEAEKDEHGLYNQVMDFMGGKDLAFPVTVMLEIYIRRFRKGSTFLGTLLPLGQPTLQDYHGLSEPVPHSEDAFVTWAGKFMAREMANVAKDEAADSSQVTKTFEYITPITATEVEAKVIKNEKDVLLVVFQEGCEHCGRIDLNLSKDGLMIPSCGVCSYSERERLLKNWQLYLEKMDGLAGMFRNVETLEFYSLNAANNTLADPTSYGMGVGFLWTPGYYMFKANDKANPERARWPGSFLDHWIQEAVSIPFDESVIVQPPPPPPPVEESADEEEEEEDADWDGEDVPEEEAEEDEASKDELRDEEL